ncbi:MAG: hypothetical protein ACFE85_18360 [Candidatus Hodarchaeota archaeon]
MTELSKEFKIVLIIDIIIGLIYGILYVFLPDLVYSTNDAPYYDPHFWRLFGGVILSIAIVVIIAFLLKKDWEEIKFFVVSVVIFLIISVIINITSALYVTRSATNLGFHWLDTILMIILIVIHGFFYMREEKK